MGKVNWRRYPATGVSTKGGWFQIGGRTYYFKSRLEVRVACHWQYMKQLGLIENWWYEDQTFRFPQKSRGVTEYTPDFSISTKTAGGFSRISVVEVKGYPAIDCLVKLRLMMQTYPGYTLLLFVQDQASLFKSLDHSHSKGNSTAGLILGTLREWVGLDPVCSRIKLVDWKGIVRNNRYGEWLFNLATPAQKPSAKERRRHSRRLVVNFDDQRLL